jgi:hypothetical protein
MDRVRTKKNAFVNTNQVRYVTGIPRKPLPKGIVLVHNHRVPQRLLGLNGFRAWTQKRTRKLVRCKCDWAGVDLRGLRHYRVNFANVGTRTEKKRSSAAG